MASVRISVEELKKASEAFVGDSSSRKMDDRIHRFPAGLRDVGERYIVPMVVVIGPYHRASNDLRNTERVKRAAAFQVTNDRECNKVYDAVVSVAGEARKLYPADALVGMGNHDFAAMMFLDACFLLQYMDAYPRFINKEDFSVEPELRRFLFTNRACINNDIMLLENQLPWLVLDEVIKSLAPHKNYMGVVTQFIQEMGDIFKIDVEIVKKEASGESNLPPSPYPPYLLDLLRRSKDVVTQFIQHMGDTFKIDENGKKEDTPVVLNNDNSPPHLLGLLRSHKIGSATIGRWPGGEWITEFSATELAQIGIKLKASTTAVFTDMDVRERGPFCGEVSMAPLSLDDTTECWLVNMAAFEVTTAANFKDDPNNTAVCSYLALLNLFMYREEDVHELRSRRILHGYQTNAEMLTFFKGVIKLLPDTGCRFAHTMARIQEYKESRKIRTKAHKFVYRNLWAIIRAVTIFGTVLGIYQQLLSLNQGQKNDTPGQ